jgi:mono/diheme cytochrome c family protein
MEIAMRAIGSLLFALFALGSTGALAQDVGDPEKGHAFASEVCAVCHAVEADDSASPNANAPTFRRIAAEPGMTATALRVILGNPHREMPDLILARDEMHDVIAYILTLKPSE